MHDSHDLERFVTAQDPVFDRVLAELRSGAKRSHWMWFVFPQLRGLGSSETAARFGITSGDEARAYLAHPVLGPRLRAATEAVLGTEGLTLNDIFGTPDDLKFRSSMTLFDAVSNGTEPLFAEALRRFCGSPDPQTLRLLRTQD